MSFASLRTRPDFTPLFGPLKPKEHNHIMDLLLRIDDRLNVLAKEASEHIQVPYQHTGLGFFSGTGRAEISGGPTGHAGDIWFEIQYSFDETSREWRRPPWSVDSRIIVFCADQDGARRGYSCTYDLVCLTAETVTPLSTVETLAAHVQALAAQLRKHAPNTFTNSLHKDLVEN